MAAPDHVKQAWEPSQYKDFYASKVRELLDYEASMHRKTQRSGGRAKKRLRLLQDTVDMAHRLWFNHRENQLAVARRKQNKSPDDHRKMVSKTERTCQQYKEVTAEFLSANEDKDVEKLELRPCWLCGKILLGCGANDDLLSRHMAHAHWTDGSTNNKGEQSRETRAPLTVLTNMKR